MLRMMHWLEELHNNLKYGDDNYDNGEDDNDDLFLKLIPYI